jgi:predicted  nucleic acid-binding Zn-ribbon protein
MDISTLQKVIELYLRGYGYGEISKRTDIARSTVQDTVNKWKDGQTGIFDEALGYVDDITGIARDMRQNGVKIEDLKMPFLNASVLKRLNIDLQELYSFYEAVRGYGSDVVSEIARTVIELQSHGTNPAHMVQKLESLGTEIKELENRKGHLENDVSSTDGELKEKNRVKESLEKEISELREIASSLKKQEKDITDEIKKNGERIEKSDKFWSAVKNMGIDPRRIEEFMENARSMGYDARTIPSIKEIERYGMDRSMSPDDMRILVLSLRQLNSAGWSPDSIVKLSMAMSGVADPPDAVIDHMQKYADKYRKVAKAIEELDRQLFGARSEHERKIGMMNRKFDELANRFGEMQRMRDSLDKEIMELDRRKQEVETAYSKAMEELRKYTGSAVHITELQDIIDKQNEMKKALETSINSLNEKLAGMRISADIAEALPSVITGKDMKIMQLCTAFIAAKNSITVAVNEGELRDRIINGIMEISAGGIVPVRYSSYDRFISGWLYDDLMRLKKERRQVSQEKSELESLRNLYGKDVKSYLEDYISGRIPSDSHGYRIIREIAGKSFQDEVRRRFDSKAILDMTGDTGGGNPFIFLTAPDRTSGSVVVGSISIRDLLANIRSDSKSIELQTKNGRVSLDTCDAIMEIMQMYLDPARLEMLRREWRESLIDPVKKQDNAGLQRYRGLVYKGDSKDSKN